jgi:hypothetical protein
MNTQQWKNLFKVAVVGGGLILPSASAQAQSFNFGDNMGARFGDLRIAHGDTVTTGVENGNIVVGGGVADGVRIGSQTVTTGIQGAGSVPAIVVAPVTAPIQAIGRAFGF